MNYSLTAVRIFIIKLTVFQFCFRG